MEVNARESITEWAVSAGYYAKYFAVYALLSRIGVRCEIHDCTITLFEHLFGSSVNSKMINEFRKSKKDRIETQYYTRKVNVDLDQLMRKTKNFVLDIEELLDDMNSEKIGQLQSILHKLKIKD